VLNQLTSRFMAPARATGCSSRFGFLNPWFHFSPGCIERMGTTGRGGNVQGTGLAGDLGSRRESARRL